MYVYHEDFRETLFASLLQCFGQDLGFLFHFVSLDITLLTQTGLEFEISHGNFELFAHIFNKFFHGAGAFGDWNFEEIHFPQGGLVFIFHLKLAQTVWNDVFRSVFIVLLKHLNRSFRDYQNGCAHHFSVHKVSGGDQGFLENVSEVSCVKISFFLLNLDLKTLVFL